MKILIIAPRLPHARVVSGHFIVYQRVKRLAERGHEVGLVAFSNPEDQAHVDELKGVVKELQLVPAPTGDSLRSRVLDYIFSSIPPRFMQYYSPDMFRVVGDMVERSRYDVVIAEFGFMGLYINQNPYLSAIRKVVSVHHCHTISSQKALDMLGYSPRALREWLAMKGLQRFEFDIFRAADRIVVLTSEERFGLLTYAPDLRINLVPSGVDTDFFKPGDPSVKEQALVFTGYYSDEPNRDAVIWFSRYVWPRLKAKYPDLIFYVVGPHPSSDMRELSRKDPRIIVTGEVDDIRPYLSRARVFVCPNRLGSGMRGKILQAMASGVPVVATSLGAEGISIQMGDNGFLADKPRIMSQYIDLLLSDATLQSNIARNAREMVVERFSWDRGVDQLEHILKEVVAGG